MREPEMKCLLKNKKSIRGSRSRPIRFVPTISLFLIFQCLVQAQTPTVTTTPAYTPTVTPVPVYQWTGTCDVDVTTGDGNNTIRVTGAYDTNGMLCPSDTRFQFIIQTAGSAAMLLNATAGWGQLELSWTPDDMEDLLAYILYRSIGDNENYELLTVVDKDTNSYVDSDVDNGTVYYYYYTIQDTDFGETQASNEASAVPGDFTPPTIPVVIDDGDDTDEDDMLHASWSSSDPETEIVEYKYAVGTTPGGTDARDWTSTGTDAEATAAGLNLVRGQVYYFSVKAKNGWNLWSDEGYSDGIFINYDTIAPGDVTGLTADPDDGQILLSWTNPADDDFVGVLIRRRDDDYPAGPEDGDFVYDGPAETFTDFDLNNGTTYYYKAFAHDAEPNYAEGVQISVAPVDGPGPANVINFTCVSGDGQADLSWTNPSDPGFSGVKILRSTEDYPSGPNDGTGVYDGNGTSHSDQGLINGLTYYYTAFSYDSTPEYSSGVHALGTPTDMTPPGDVAGFTAMMDDEAIQLDWTNPGDPDFAGVLILRKTDDYPADPSDGDEVYNSPGNSFTDAGLTNGQTYYYAAFAYDGIPNYSTGSQASAVPEDVEPPDDVSGLTAQPGYEQMTLRWQNPVDSDLEGIKVLRKPDDFPTSPFDGTEVYNGLDEEMTDTGLTYGEPYYYAVFSYDEVPNWSPGAFVSATTAAITRWTGTYDVDVSTGDGINTIRVSGAKDFNGMESPTDARFQFIIQTSGSQAMLLNATAGWSQVELSWTECDLENLLAYILYRSVGDNENYEQLTVMSKDSTSFLEEDVENGTVYYYYYSIMDTGFNETHSSNEASAVPGDFTPPTVPLITDDGDATDRASELHASWSSGDPETGVVEYIYAIGDSPGGIEVVSWTSVGTDAEVTKTGLNLTRGETYYFSVKAKNGWDLWSDEGYSDGIFVNYDIAPPDDVSGLTAEPDDMQILLSWTNPGDEDFAGVKIQRSTDVYPSEHDDGFTVYDGDGVSCFDVDLTNGITCYYTAFAYDGVPNYSSGVQAEAAPANAAGPSNVVGFAAVAGDEEVHLSWTAPADPAYAGIKIQRSADDYPASPEEGTTVYEGADTGYTDAGLTNGILYYYAAFSYDATPEYSSGVNASAQPADMTPPGEVSDFTATPGDEQNELSWTNPGSPDFAGVRIMRKTTDYPAGPFDGTMVYEGMENGCTDQGLINGETCYYTAFTFDGIPNYSAGSQASATPADVEAPADVSNVQSNPGYEQITLKWTNPEDADLAGIKIIRRDDDSPAHHEDGDEVYDGLDEKFTDTGLTYGEDYYYAIFTYDVVPNYSSGVQSMTTTAAITRWIGSYDVNVATGDGINTIRVAGAYDFNGMEAPTDTRFDFVIQTAGSAAMLLNAAAGWSQVELSWPETDLETLLSYNIYRSIGDNQNYELLTVVGKDTTEYADSELENGTAYYYYYSIMDTDFNETQGSNEASAVPDDFTTPTVPLVTDDGDTTDVWTELHAVWSAEDPESGISEYQYAIGLSQSGNEIVDWTSTGMMTEVTHSGLNLNPGETYYFSVKAKNGRGLWSDEGYSDGITAVYDTKPPGNVEDFTAIPGDGTVSLSWTNPGDADFAGVAILSKTDEFPADHTDGETVYDGSGDSTVHQGLTNGLTYYYAVFSYDEIPNYSSGSFITAVPLAPTSTPTDTPSLTPTYTQTPTKTPTTTPTLSPTRSPTGTPTDIPIKTPTLLPTETPTDTPTNTGTTTPTRSPTRSPTQTPTPTITYTSPFTPTNTKTITPTNLPTALFTGTPICSPTPTPTSGMQTIPSVHPVGLALLVISVSLMIYALRENK